MATELSLTEQLAFSTVRIQCADKNGRISTGTGFFFNFLRSENGFVPTVVTNRHVVKDTVRGTFYLTERAADGSPLIGTSHPHTIENFQMGWIDHPDPDVDLCIMPLGGFLNLWEQRGPKYYFSGFERSLIADAKRLQDMAALEPVVMIGYPVGIWDEKNNMPIFRRGVAATHPYLDYHGKREFLIDMACFPGSSGSPVVFVHNGFYSDKLGRNIVGRELKLLGILYAGPQYTAHGDIVILPVPTQLRPVPVTHIPTNLGHVIKAERLLEFEPLLKRQMDDAPGPAPAIPTIDVHQ